MSKEHDNIIIYVTTRNMKLDINFMLRVHSPESLATDNYNYGLIFDKNFIISYIIVIKGDDAFSFYHIKIM